VKSRFLTFYLSKYIFGTDENWRNWTFVSGPPISQDFGTLCNFASFDTMTSTRRFATLLLTHKYIKEE
jgi:hypothetical protein